MRTWLHGLQTKRKTFIWQRNSTVKRNHTIKQKLKSLYLYIMGWELKNSLHQKLTKASPKVILEEICIHILSRIEIKNP